MNIFSKKKNLENRHLLEFYPDVVLTIPKHVGGGCCIKAVEEQTKESQKMHLFAQELRSKYKNNIELVIPSKCTSKSLAKVKWVRFKTILRISRLKIKKLPALVIDNEILCEGKISNPKLIENDIENRIFKKEFYKEVKS